jgi:hypothetical protein
METTYPINCSCTLSAVRVLMRIEQLVEETKVGLETYLQVMEDAENRCYTVLNCAACCQRRLSLASVTVVSATITEWVQGAQQLAGGSLSPSVSLGDKQLEGADADILTRELLRLQLDHFVKVLARLESTLSATRLAHTAAYQDVVRAKMEDLQECRRRVLIGSI